MVFSLAAHVLTVWGAHKEQWRVSHKTGACKNLPNELATEAMVLRLTALLLLLAAVCAEVREILQRKSNPNCISADQLLVAARTCCLVKGVDARLAVIWYIRSMM
jgi:hypothetical protein